MSYARFSEGDVYVFLNVSGYFECCACRLAPVQDGAIFHDSLMFDVTDEIVVHVHEHKAAGHDVPDRCLEGLEEERAENEAWLAGERAARGNLPKEDR